MVCRSFLLIIIEKFKCCGGTSGLRTLYFTSRLCFIVAEPCTVGQKKRQNTSIYFNSNYRR